MDYKWDEVGSLDFTFNSPSNPFKLTEKDCNEAVRSGGIYTYINDQFQLKFNYTEL